MSDVDVSYQEAGEILRVDAVPLAHLSVQTGQVLLGPDLLDGGRILARQAERAAPWLAAAAQQVRDRFGRDARISTCVLVDDHTPSYAGELPGPVEVMAALRDAARRAGFRLDYLARRGGCGLACDRPFPGPRDQSPLADFVAELIVEEAAVGANGSRPPTTLSGWLSNGERSPGVSMAMDAAGWRPPRSFGDRHSVFVDVELWSVEPDGRAPAGGGSERRYSASLLTAVWHLLRLGLLRDDGRAVAVPYRCHEGEEFPGSWSLLPSVIQLEDDAAPFPAYQTLSLLPAEHRPAEHAARLIIDHLRHDEAVLRQTRDRAGAERHGIGLPERVADRIGHLFLDDVRFGGPVG